MTPERFDHLLSLVKEQIEKKDTRFRKSIPAAARLAIVLRYLASGETQQPLSYSYQVGRSTVPNIVSKRCIAIYESLKGPYLTSPSSVNDWKCISERFEEVWNFPHVVGGIDGKHIYTGCPKLSGTLYHNYNGFFSMVLLAVCDGDHCFRLFDFGSYGSNNDCVVLANSLLGKGLETNKIQLPLYEPLDGCAFSPLPYYLLGDDIFTLKKWLIKPYPGKKLTKEQKIYNYRLSRCHWVIKNACGMLSARWRIFHRPIRATVEHVERCFSCLSSS